MRHISAAAAGFAGLVTAVMLILVNSVFESNFSFLNTDLQIFEINAYFGVTATAGSGAQAPEPAPLVPTTPKSTESTPPEQAQPPTPAGTIQSGVAQERRSDGLSLFCFAWTPRRGYDEQLLTEVRKQFAKCDGHVFYTDKDSGGDEAPDFVRVELPAQKVARSDKGWLYHRNMVGLMPAWSHLLSSNFVAQHDWFINSELDHFLSPARARKNIAQYKEVAQASDDSPTVLMWGNAFVFNRRMMEELQKNWDSLGKTASMDSSVKDEVTAVGCPLFMKGKSEWPHSCSQDIIYPALAWDVLPKRAKVKVVTLGDPGCGHPAKYKGKDLTLGCWEMQQNPWGGESKEGELSAIRVLAEMESMDKDTATTYCANHHSEAVVKNCMKFYDGRHVAVIHHVNNIAIHELARQLLDHEGSEPPSPPPSTPAPAEAPAPVPSPLPAIESQASPGQDHSQDAGMKLFCFAWSPRRKNDEGMLNEVRRQYRKCDGHLFFTDTESPVKEDEEDFVRVHVPKQRVERTHGQWLYHRNMAGLMPAWDHLLRSGVAEKYDWLINSELDHFLSPKRAKETILEYLRGMEDGSKEDKSGLGGPIMLMWGNAFVFNRKFVQVLRQNWPLLGRVATSSEGESKQGRAVGCPLFMKNRFEWPDSCSQDIIYPTLAMNVLPPLNQKVAFPGASGCGQPSKNRRNKPYPLGCWEMQQNPLNGESEKGELGAIEELAKMRSFKDKWEARAYCKTSNIEAVQKNCMKFWDGRNVPVIHHLHTVSEHKLARALLDNDPDPA